MDVHLHHICRRRRLLRPPHRAGRPYIGQHSEKPFEEIWNSPPLVSLRGAHLAKREDHPYHEHCSWCFKNRYADFEHEIRPDLSSILVTNSTVPSFEPMTGRH